MRSLTNRLGALCFLFASPFAWAECVDLGNATNWSDVNPHKIIMYQQGKAIAVLEIPSCAINKTSNIQLTDSIICNEDKILISEQLCKVHNIKEL